MAQEQKQSITTDGFTLYPSTTSKVKTALNLGFWQSNFSIKISPMLEDSDVSNPRFDYRNSITTAITKEKGLLILEAIRSRLVPIIKKEPGVEIVDHSIGVQTGLSNLFTVGVKINLDGIPIPYINIHKEIDASSRIPVQTAEFEFGQITLIKDYDPKTGKYESELNNYNSFYLFMYYLQSGIDAMSNAEVHNTRVVMNNTISLIRDIGAKVGVNVNTNYNQNRQLFTSENSSTTGTPAADASIEVYDNIENLNEILQ